jgi:hypothetical protein
MSIIGSKEKNMKKSTHEALANFISDKVEQVDDLFSKSDKIANQIESRFQRQEPGSEQEKILSEALQYFTQLGSAFKKIQSNLHRIAGDLWEEFDQKWD